MNDYDQHIQRLKKAAHDDRSLRAADEGYAWLLFWILVVVIFLAMGVMFLVGRDHAPVVYVVATPTPEASYVRFLCYHDGAGRMIPGLIVTWQRENGQTVTATTDAYGCVLIPADENVGVEDPVRQVYRAIWTGSRPVCVNYATGEVIGGNLCPPGR